MREASPRLRGRALCSNCSWAPYYTLPPKIPDQSENWHITQTLITNKRVADITIDTGKVHQHSCIIPPLHRRGLTFPRYDWAAFIWGSSWRLSHVINDSPAPVLLMWEYWVWRKHGQAWEQGESVRSYTYFFLFHTQLYWQKIPQGCWTFSCVCLSACLQKLQNSSLAAARACARPSSTLLIIYLKLLTLGSRTSNYTNYLHNKQSVFSIFTEVWKPGSDILSTLIRFFFA